jgi:hypothetical protein
MILGWGQFSSLSDSSFSLTTRRIPGLGDVQSRLQPVAVPTIPAMFTRCTRRSWEPIPQALRQQSRQDGGIVGTFFAMLWKCQASDAIVRVEVLAMEKMVKYSSVARTVVSCNQYPL